MARSLILFASGLTRVSGHGAMLTPVPRSTGDKDGTPIDPESTENQCGARNPYSTASTPGEYCGYGCTGDACLWYQIGCFQSCGNCSMQGKDLYPTAEDLRLAGDCEPAAATINSDELRSYNLGAAAGSSDDWTQVMPWRAPGTAGLGNPDFNPCGRNSGDKTGALPPSTAYPNDVNMPGTELPPVAGTAATWKAGSTQEVEYGIYAHHAGGVSYRLCKLGDDGMAGVTEDCFQQTPLDFASDNTTVKYHDGSRDPFQIAATTTAEGTYPKGSQWRKIPVPMCNCDYGTMCKNGWDNKKQDGWKAYDDDHLHPGQKLTSPACTTGVQFETAWDDGYGAGMGDDLKYGEFQWTLIDEVQVPEGLAPGAYALSWRWDCEQTPQVWNSCADVTVVA